MVTEWQNGNITLYCADCRDVMSKLLVADALVTDPPYGVNYSHGAGGGCAAKSTKFDHHPVVGDNLPFDPGIWLGFRQIILWGANHYASRLPSRSQWLVWDKRDSMLSNDQADCELAWTNMQKPARLRHHIWNGMIKASERGTQRVHPTQKPIFIMEWCLSFINPNYAVVDPYMGSGTTGIACVKTGHPFIGVEIMPDMFEVAKQRIQEAQDAKNK